MKAIADTKLKSETDILCKVIEIIDKHIDVTARPSPALRRVRKEVIEKLLGVSEESWDINRIFNGPVVSCDYYKQPHTLNIGHNCKNPK